MTAALGVQVFFSDLDVGACVIKENVPIGAFNIAFESTQNKQLQYGTKIIGAEVRKKLW